MFRPSMNESYRRNDSLANAKWGSLAGPTAQTIRPTLHSNNSNSNREEPRIRPRWIQEIQEQQNLDAATALLRSTTIGNKKSKSRKQSLLVPKSPTSSLLDSLAKQRRRERWLEMLPTRPQSMGSIARSKASRKFPAEDPRWNERIRQVKEFVREHGHGRIPINYPPNQELARWSKRQRFHYRLFLKNQRTKFLCADSELSQDGGCQMTQEHLQDLNEAGFCFDLQVARWDRNYQLLKRSQSVPTQHKNAELRKWIEMQRFQMSLLKRGGKTFLNPERIQKLNDIGFAWHNTSTKNISNLNLEEQDYKARTEHCGGIDADLFQLDGHNSGSRLCHDSVPTEIVVVQSPTNECI